MKHLFFAFSAIHLRFIPYAFLSIGKPYFSEYYCGEHLRYCVENWDNELNTWDNVWRTERVYTLIYLGSCALKTDRRSIENCCVLKLSLRLFLYESMIIWRLPAWKLRRLLNACWDLRWVLLCIRCCWRPAWRVETLISVWRTVTIERFCQLRCNESFLFVIPIEIYPRWLLRWRLICEL